jgi:hypothetical protein
MKNDSPISKALSVKNRWWQIQPQSYVVAGGAAGFVDTDVSGTTNSGLGVFVCFTAGAAQKAGARESGSASDTTIDIVTGINLFVGIAKINSGHVELYRAANNNNYLLMGYWL